MLGRPWPVPDGAAGGCKPPPRLAGIGLTLLDEQSELMPDLLSAGLLAQASTAELPTTNAMSEL